MSKVTFASFCPRRYSLTMQGPETGIGRRGPFAIDAVPAE